MKQDLLMHGIGTKYEYFSMEESLEKLNQIVTDGYLYSRRLQDDLDPNKGGFSGMDYISFCDYSLKDASPFENNSFYHGYTAYENYISNSLSLGIERKGIRIITPELISPCVFDWNSLEEMRRLGLSKTKRYSDFPDEVQVKNKVSLKKLNCLTLPISLMLKNEKNITYTADRIFSFIIEVERLLQQNSKMIPIYDIGSGEKINEYEDVRKVYQKYKK